MRDVTKIIGIGVGAAVLGGGGAFIVTDGMDDEKPRTLVEDATTPTPAPGPTDAPVVKPDKLVIIVRENKGFNQVNKQAWSKAMGAKFGLATNIYAWGHPSQPNYVVMLAGSNRGITSNSTARVSGASLQGKIPAGDFWLFGQTMSSDNCRLSQRGYYHPRHIPTTVFKDERAQCEKTTVGYDKIKPKIADGTLPKVSMIVPNNCKNAHDCSLPTSEAWTKTEVERLMAGPDYQSGRLVIASIWDEDAHNEGNHIHAVVIHPSLDHKVVTTRLTLYSVHKSMAEFGGVVPLTTKGKEATSLTTAFGVGAA